MNKYKLVLLALCVLVVQDVCAQVAEFRYNGAADVIFSFPPRGTGGRAFVHDVGNVLTLNYEGDFTGGTKIGNNFIINGGGNVGVGIVDPKAALHVAGSVLTGGASIDPYHALGDLNFLRTSGQMLIGWNRSAGGGETDFISNPQGGDRGGFAFYNFDNSGNENQLMWIHANGNVAIGTQNPSGYKLAVNGNIHAKEVNIDVNNWPDYVFDKGYKLASLADLEQYLLKNKHLPGMKSAREVEANGLNLAQTNRILAEKVEELTLYLLQKDKEIRAQEFINLGEKRVNEIQQQQIQALMHQVDELEKRFTKK